MERQRKRQAEFDRKRALGITEDENDDNDNENENGNKKKTNAEGDDDEDEEVEEVEDNVVHEQGSVMRGFYRGASSDKFVITMVRVLNSFFPLIYYDEEPFLVECKIVGSRL